MLVAREAQVIRERLVVRVPGEAIWDGRFRLSFRSASSGRRADVVVAALGRAGWSKLAERRPEFRGVSIPDRVRHGLPALWSNGRLVGVPHLGYRVGYRARVGAGTLEIRCEARFWPRQPLAGAEFSVV